MILNLEGAVDELTVLEVKLHTPFTARHWIRLKYAHLPELPLNNGFDAGITFGEEPNDWTVDIPPFTSIEELVDILNGFRDNQNRHVISAFYDGREFEMFGNAVYDITLTEDLQDFLKCPMQVIPALQGTSAALFKDRLMTYSHWNIYVKNLKGMFDGMAHSELLAKVRDDGTIYGETHTFASDVRNLQVSVIPVQKDGVIVTGYVAKSNYSIGLEFGV